MSDTQPLVPIIPLTYTQFLADFPEFSTNEALYPQTSFNFWLNVAGTCLNANRFGTLLVQAAELYVAHNLAIEAKDMQTALNGGTPGFATASGPMSSKSVGGVGAGYATSLIANPRDGYWNLTIYGLRLARWLQMAGMAPVQINGPNLSPPYNSDPYYGPITQTWS